MSIDFSRLFHRASRGDSQETPSFEFKKDNEFPPELKTILYKTYPRLPRIPLPKRNMASGVLESIQKRSSTRLFSGKPITLDTLSTILAYSCGEIGDPVANGRTRAQPSGGPLYPIETYVLIFKRSDDLVSGAYHYNIKEHALELLSQKEFTKKDIAGLFVYEWVADSSAAILLTSVFDRTKVKYGQRGYRYALLEAGHIGQNVYLTAREVGIGCCAMGGTKDEAIEKLLHIDGEEESLIYSLILGSQQL